MVEYTETGRTTGDEQMKMKYAVVFEQTPNNYSAYPPDLPGCISTGKTWSDIHDMIRDAMTLHIESMLEDGEPLPQPQMSLEDAMSHHCQSLVEFKETLTDFGDGEPRLSTTFEMVEIEVSVDRLEAVVGNP